MKNFDEWNNRKKIIHETDKLVIPSKKQIWWVSVGFNIGDEEDGKNKNNKWRFSRDEKRTKESYWINLKNENPANAELSRTLSLSEHLYLL